MKDIKSLLLVTIMLLGASVIYASGSDCCCGTGTSSCCNTCCTSDCDCCDNYCGCIGGKYTNKTFFADYINFFQSGSYMHAALFPNCRMWKRTTEDGDCGWGGAFQIVPFGGRTTSDGGKDLGRWFGLNHSASLIAVEEVGTNAHAANAMVTTGAALDVRHFNIQTVDGTFQSTVTFCPKQTFAGVGLDWKQTLWRNTDETTRWWAELSGPVLHVKNSMRMTEDVTTTGGGAVDATGLDEAARVGTMTAAFAQSNWKYGKIVACGGSCCGTTTTTTTTSTCGCGCDCKCECGCDMERTALAFLELKFGYNEVITDCCMLGSYLGVVFPTGKEACPGFVFSPMVGGKHWGIMWGSEIGFTMWTNDDSAIRARFSVDGRYLFKHNETRSFDLVGKPWSRYMEMYENQAAAVAAYTAQASATGTSGINIMTRCVDVTPRGQLNMNTGIIYDGKCFKAEIGHTWYGRQAEKICPNWETDTTLLPVLKGYNGTGIVAKARTIRDRFTGSTVTVGTGPDLNNAALLYSDTTLTAYNAYKIAKCDVDWNSAAHEAVLAHSVYGTLGYDWGEACYPTIVTVGGAFDWNESNTAMRRWTVFGKLGVSF